MERVKCIRMKDINWKELTSSSRIGRRVCAAEQSAAYSSRSMVMNCLARGGVRNPPSSCLRRRSRISLMKSSTSASSRRYSRWGSWPTRRRTSSCMRGRLSLVVLSSPVMIKQPIKSSFLNSTVMRSGLGAFKVESPVFRNTKNRQKSQNSLNFTENLILM